MIKVSELRVTAGLDTSAYSAAAQDKIRADRAMGASGVEARAALKRLADAATDTSGKIARSGNGVAQLARQYVDGFRQLEKVERDLRRLNSLLESGKIDAQSASAIYAGMSAQLNINAGAAELAARGHVLLAAAVRDSGGASLRQTSQVQQHTAALRANEAAAEAAAAANARAAAHDNSQFRRQNLGYQAFDIGQGLMMGAPVGMIAAQQLPQIAQLYAAQGGLNALWKDAIGILGTLARVAGPWIAAGAAIYGGYRLIASYGQEAALAVDDATAALAAQAAPVDSLSGRVSELQRITDLYAKAIRGTAKDQSIATASIIANSEREFNAKKSLLELELKRQKAAIEARKAELAIAGLGMQREVGTQMATRPDFEGRGFADPRIGSVPFVRTQDASMVGRDGQLRDFDFMGLRRTMEILENSAAADKMKELRAELTLAEIAVTGVEDALKTTFSQGVEVSIGRIAKSTGGAANAYRDLIKNAQDRIDQMRLEEQLIGKTGVAADALRFRLELLQDATDKGRTVDAKKLAVIDALTAAYQKQAARLAELQALDELAFERAQIGRSPTEQRVYGELRQIGLDINSIEGKRIADAIRLNERLAGQKQLIQDIGDILVDSFSRGDDVIKNLIANAGRLGQAIEQSGVFGDKVGKSVSAGLGGLSSGYGAADPLLGALGGAASGLGALLTGNPLPAIIGGISGLLGGLIGQAKKAREEAAATAKSMQDLSLRMLQVSTSTDTLEGALQVFDAQAGLEVARLREARKAAELILATERALALDRLVIQRDFAQKERDAARDVLQRAYDAESGALNDLAGAHRSFAASLTQFREALLLDTAVTPLDSGKRLAEAQRQFTTTQAAAAGGDEAAMGRLADVARNYLDEALSYFAATSDYFAIFNDVDAKLAGLVDGSVTQASAAERQAAALEAQYAPLLGIEQGILSLGAAAAAYQSADMAYQAAQLAVSQQQTAALQALAANQNNPATQAMPSLIERLFNTGNSSQGLFDRIFNWAPGFATGGDFTVRGSGGTDSVPVMFRASPGEHVSVRTPAQVANGSSTNDNGLRALASAQASGSAAIVAAINQLSARMDAMDRSEDRRARESGKFRKAS